MLALCGSPDIWRLWKPLLPPPKKEIMFLLQSVCLLDKWKSCEQIWTKFLGGVGHGLGTKWLNFGDDPDPGVRSPKFGFTGLSKKYLVDSDQSCIANVHCKNHSAILLCWRSAEVCALWVLLVCYVKIWDYLCAGNIRLKVLGYKLCYRKVCDFLSNYSISHVNFCVRRSFCVHVIAMCHFVDCCKKHSTTVNRMTHCNKCSVAVTFTALHWTVRMILQWSQTPKVFFGEFWWPTS